VRRQHITDAVMAAAQESILLLPSVGPPPLELIDQRPPLLLVDLPAHRLW